MDSQFFNCEYYQLGDLVSKRILPTRYYLFFDELNYKPNIIGIVINKKQYTKCILVKWFINPPKCTFEAPKSLIKIASIDGLPI